MLGIVHYPCMFPPGERDKWKFASFLSLDRESALPSSSGWGDVFGQDHVIGCPARGRIR